MQNNLRALLQMVRDADSETRINAPFVAIGAAIVVTSAVRSAKYLWRRRPGLSRRRVTSQATAALPTSQPTMAEEAAASLPREPGETDSSEDSGEHRRGGERLEQVYTSATSAAPGLVARPDSFRTQSPEARSLEEDDAPVAAAGAVEHDDSAPRGVALPVVESESFRPQLESPGDCGAATERALRLDLAAAHARLAAMTRQLSEAEAARLTAEADLADARRQLEEWCEYGQTMQAVVSEVTNERDDLAVKLRRARNALSQDRTEIRQRIVDLLAVVDGSRRSQTSSFASGSETDVPESLGGTRGPTVAPYGPASREAQQLRSPPPETRPLPRRHS